MLKLNEIGMEKIKMQNKKMIILVLLLVPIFLVSGCSSSQKPEELTVESVPVERQQNDSIAKRFQEQASESPTVVESAMKLSGEYARLTREAAELQQQNEDYIAKNRQLNEQVASLDAQLQQAQKELAQANNLLIEMRVELNNWKADILGFRNEMRDAETAQLETLLRILKVLGGQVTTESARAEDASTVGSAVASLNKPDRP
jgi:ABC-type Fe3+-citrate transport system substrate-binding protein